MATVTFFSSRRINPGTRTLPAVPIPIGVTGVEILRNRDDMTSPTLSMMLTMELSTDGGATWRPWGGHGTVGGVFVSDRTGLVVTDDLFRVGLLVGHNPTTRVTRVGAFTVEPDEVIEPGFEPTNPNRQLRGAFTTNEAVTMGITIKTTP